MSYINNWFSNMTLMDSPYIHEGISYNTSENFYQAMKLPAHHVERRKHLSEMNPYDSKSAFRIYPHFFTVRASWNSQEKLRVMREILDWKFQIGTSWHKKLMETTDDIVEYNNWGDTFWGVTIHNNEGSNHLGKILMDIRDGFNRIDLTEFGL